MDTLVWSCSKFKNAVPSMIPKREIFKFLAIIGALFRIVILLDLHIQSCSCFLYADVGRGEERREERRSISVYSILGSFKPYQNPLTWCGAEM